MNRECRHVKAGHHLLLLILSVVNYKKDHIPGLRLDQRIPVWKCIRHVEINYRQYVRTLMY